MSSRSLLPAFLLSLLLRPLAAWAQNTNATCSSTYDWADNSRGQSPCVVASYLQGTCVTGAFNIRALPPGSHYSGPSVSGANSCYCSTVLYSLVSACGDCQGRTFIGWIDWSLNCTRPDISKFSNNIPALTAVPSWAYLDVVTPDTYNPVLAQSEARLQRPESTRSAGSTGTGRPAPTGDSGSSTNVGAIAGGVVGGVVGLGLIVGLIVWLVLRRRRSQAAPSIQYASAPPHDPDMHQKGVYGSEPSTAGSPFRPYDPSDPSTFPATPGATSTYTDYNDGYRPNSTVNHPYSNRYTGAPEI
ncbi:hypothetical protein HGRIS_012879 [Hohenbuehelia grisea]|uniref:Transmembrane protein n=1 Tax=Hohenbuehelia grisea TaxID=104357 RepID=A0ABR3ITP7_9AGAR